MIRIVFAADSHLNRTYARMTPDQLAARRGRLRSAWKQSVDHALAEGADLYVHGGDLFDSPNPRSVELAWAARQLQRLTDAGVEVFLLGGNHDVPRTRHHGAAPQGVFAEVRLAHVFTEPGGVTWRVVQRNGMRLALGGLPPDPRLAAGDDPLARTGDALVPPAADAAILVVHHAVEGLGHPDAEEPTIRRASIRALAGRIDAVLAGHLHGGGEAVIGGVPVLFPGPTERLTFGEIDVRCGFYDVAVAPGAPPRVRARHVRVEPQPMRRLVVEARDVPASEPTEWLLARIRGASSADQILQLRLRGSLPRDTYRQIRFGEVWRMGAEANFYFDLDRHGLVVAEAELAPAVGAGGTSPRAELRRVAAAMRAESGDDADRRLIEEALALVLDRYGAGTVDEAPS